jgi:hypothetical protein
MYKPLSVGAGIGDRELPLAEIRNERLERLYHYWLECCGGREMPARRDLRPEDMVKCLGIINLIDVVEAPTRFRFRLIGTDVVNAYGEDMTGRMVDEVRPDAYASILIRQFGDVVTGRRVMLHEFMFAATESHLNFRRLTLPLSSNGRDIDMLLTGSAFGREIRREILDIDS